MNRKESGRKRSLHLGWCPELRDTAKILRDGYLLLWAIFECGLPQFEAKVLTILHVDAVYNIRRQSIKKPNLWNSEPASARSTLPMVALCCWDFKLHSDASSIMPCHLVIELVALRHAWSVGSTKLNHRILHACRLTSVCLVCVYVCGLCHLQLTNLFHIALWLRMSGSIPPLRCTLYVLMKRIGNFTVFKCNCRLNVDNVMALRRCSLSVNPEGRFHSQDSPWGICGVRGGRGTGFSSNTSVSTCQYHFNLHSCNFYNM